MTPSDQTSAAGVSGRGPGEQLGGHVGGRPRGGAGAGHPGLPVGVPGMGRVALEPFGGFPGEQGGDAEVADQRPAVPVDQDVGRLQVAVEDAGGVGVADGEGDPLKKQGRGLRRVAREILLVPGQTPAGNVGHHEVGFAVGQTGREDGHDVRVGELGQRLHLPLEPPARGRHTACAGT